MRNEADYLLRELAWEDWFVAAVMSPPKIVVRRRVRGLKDLPALFKPFGKRMLPSVHLGRLAAWIETKVGDRELADAIRAVDADDTIAYLRKCEKVSDIVERRLSALRSAQEVSHG